MSASLRIGDYEILIQPGNTDSLLISFSGIGLPNLEDYTGPINWEFIASSRMEPQPYRVFIKDWNRSWLNSSHGREAIISIIKETINSNKISRTVSIGCSMGGSCALFLASQIKLDACVVFGCQTIINNDLDNRWQRLTSRYKDGPFQDVVGLLTGFSATRIYAISGTQAWRDVWQTERLSSYHNIRTLIVPWGGHNVAGDLKRQGLLDEIVYHSMKSNESLDNLFDRYSFDRNKQAKWLSWALGWESLTKGEAQSAEKNFLEAIHADENFTYAFYGIAKSQMLQDRNAQAIAHLKEAIGQNPDLPFLYTALSAAELGIITDRHKRLSATSQRHEHLIRKLNALRAELFLID
jgi:hypothetical protein